MCPPRRLCQCLTSWSDSPSLVPLSPKGDHGLHFYLPPEWGTARGGASQLGPQKECSPCSLGQVGVLAGGGHVGTSRLRSVSVEPLQNTKLGTPGAPQPGALAPPPPHPGQPSWVGGLEGGILGSLDPDTEPHPSPSTRAPTGHLHAWRWGPSPPPLLSGYPKYFKEHFQTDKP